MTAKKMKFPISDDGIRAGLDALLASADQSGVARSIAHRLAVIVDEYCSNLIRHDKAVNSGSYFHVDLTSVPGGAMVSIRDSASAFDPTTHLVRKSGDIGGQGISLIRGLSARLDYRTDEGGNVFEATVLEED